MSVTRAGADGGTPSDEKMAEAEKMPIKRADSPASGAPRNDGEQSFSTKERFAACLIRHEKGRFFKKTAHFSRFLGDVLRTLC